MDNVDPHPHDDAEALEVNEHRPLIQEQNDGRVKLKAQVLMEVSGMATCWSVLFQCCVAPSAYNLVAAFTGLCAVTPLTNLTFWDLPYQLYLNTIFHREWLSFYAHATTMPCIIFSILAAAAQLKFADIPPNDSDGWQNWVDLSLVFVGILFLWYCIWGLLSRTYWLGPCAIPILTVVYVGAHYYQQYVADSFNPLYLMVIFSELQSWSHVVEDIPPRVNVGILWTTKRDFFCRPPGNLFLANTLGVDSNCRFLLFVSIRAFRAILQALFFGALDELLASPRLLVLFWSACPVRWVLKKCGKDPFADWYVKFESTIKERQARAPSELAKDNQCSRCCNAIATNECVVQMCCPGDIYPSNEIPNPALDYIGFGGGVFTRFEDPNHQPMPITTACCQCLHWQNTPINQVDLDAETARKLIFQICPNTCAPSQRDQVYEVAVHRHY